MRARYIGRALGIGVRVAGRIAGQCIATQAPRGQTATLPRTVPVPSAPSRSGSVARAKQGVSQGVGGFLRPFRRIGGILWLEVTGVLFLLPVLVFGPTLWRLSVSYSHTTDHHAFWASAIVVTVFLYLGVSSFWRARRR